MTPAATGQTRPPRARRRPVGWPDAARKLALLVLVPWLGACGGGADELRVLAASSLTEAFTDLARVYEREHGVAVGLSFAGSQVLRLQIEQGADADVFASAHPDHVRALQRAGRLGQPRPFAYNTLAIAVPPGDPAGIGSLEGLPRAERLVLAAATVPAGRYTRTMLEQASVRLGAPFLADVLGSVVSEEANVRLARAKVELGEADAAIVYLSDAQASNRVAVIEIPAGDNVRATYVAAALLTSEPPAAARAWLDLLVSERGRAILRARGFLVE